MGVRGCVRSCGVSGKLGGEREDMKERQKGIDDSWPRGCRSVCKKMVVATTQFYPFFGSIFIYVSKRQIHSFFFVWVHQRMRTFPLFPSFCFVGFRWHLRIFGGEPQVVQAAHCRWPRWRTRRGFLLPGWSRLCQAACWGATLLLGPCVVCVTVLGLFLIVQAKLDLLRGELQKIGSVMRAV